MKTMKVGDHLVVTARVSRILDPNAVIVKDVDLPSQGLLVLGRHSDPLHRDDLLTAAGTVERFELAQLADRYALSHSAAYRIFTDAKCLIAADIRSDA